MDPRASRETLDHSIMYIFTVALEDGHWHHAESYSAERAARASTQRLWRSIETREDPEWTRRYHSTDPREKAFGGRVELFLRDGSRVTDELNVANAHPLGAKPFARDDYRRKFRSLTAGVITAHESERFLDAVEELPRLKPGELRRLNVAAPSGTLIPGQPGIF
jgi:2-methylcitrate dehydratase